MADDADTPGPPDLSLVEEWDHAVEGRSTKERVYEVVTALTDPTKVSTIADRADCSPNGARSTLDWFEDLGIVERVASEPALYRRNEAYFDFLRAHRLATEYDPDALARLAEEYESRDTELADRFGVTDPDGVEPGAVEAEADFETVADRVSEWRAVRRRLRDLRRAQLLVERDDRSGAVPV